MREVWLRPRNSATRAFLVTLPVVNILKSAFISHLTMNVSQLSDEFTVLYKPRYSFCDRSFCDQSSIYDRSFCDQSIYDGLAL